MGTVVTEKGNVDSTTGAPIETEAAPVKSFAQQVQEMANTLTYDPSTGKHNTPEGEISEELLVAVETEGRRRTDQSRLGSTMQELRVAKAQNLALNNRLNSAPQSSLTEAELAELNDLKYSDPDAWRTKVNGYEALQQKGHDDAMAEATTNAAKEGELASRQEILDQFSADHDEFTFTDAMLQNDIPPRITKKLENGTITFEAFLNESYAYLNKAKVIKTGVEVTKTPNLGKAGGGSTVDEANRKASLVGDYKNDVY